MSDESFNIGETILLALQTNGWETAIPYSLYDKYKYIQKMYPIRESFNRYVRKIKAKKLANAIGTEYVPDTNKATFTEGSEGAVAESTSTRIKTLESLLDACKVDLDVWYVASHTVNSWEQNSTSDGITTLFQVKANLARIKPRIPVLQPIILPHVTRRLPPPLVRTNKSLVIGDAQIGFNRLKDGTWETFHDERALRIILQIVENDSFDNIVLLGDFLDCTEASKYIQKPEYAGTLQKSINEFGDFLSQIRTLAKESRIVFMAGNHEKRLQNSMVDNLKYAYGLSAYKEETPVMSLKNLLALDSMDIEYIEEYPSGVFWINKNLKIIHGEFVSVAKELSVSDVHTIMGHIHQQITMSKTIHGNNSQKQVSVHSVGCLCKIDNTVPGVISRPSWQQGAIVVDHIDDHIGVNHVYIQDGVCLYQGKKYVG